MSKRDPKAVLANVMLWRRRNLRQVMDDRGGGQALAKALGYSSHSYVSQLTSPTSRARFGEAAARDIEIRLGLPAGSLDLPPPTYADTPKVDAPKSSDAVLYEALLARGVRITPAVLTAALGFHRAYLSSNPDAIGAFVDVIAAISKV
jgi:hypothetical protein